MTCHMELQVHTEIDNMYVYVRKYLHVPCHFKVNICTTQQSVRFRWLRFFLLQQVIVEWVWIECLHSCTNCLHAFLSCQVQSHHRLEGQLYRHHPPCRHQVVLCQDTWVWWVRGRVAMVVICHLWWLVRVCVISVGDFLSRSIAKRLPGYIDYWETFKMWHNYITIQMHSFIFYN